MQADIHMRMFCPDGTEARPIRDVEYETKEGLSDHVRRGEHADEWALCQVLSSWCCHPQAMLAVMQLEQWRDWEWVVTFVLESPRLLLDLYYAVASGRAAQVHAVLARPLPLQARPKPGRASRAQRMATAILMPETSWGRAAASPGHFQIPAVANVAVGLPAVAHAGTTGDSAHSGRQPGPAVTQEVASGSGGNIASTDAAVGRVRIRSMSVHRAGRAKKQVTRQARRIKDPRDPKYKIDPANQFKHLLEVRAQARTGGVSACIVATQDGSMVEHGEHEQHMTNTEPWWAAQLGESEGAISITAAGGLSRQGERGNNGESSSLHCLHLLLTSAAFAFIHWL
jgi:hypothetical protein